MFSDFLDDEAPKAKRPRVGRPVETILKPVEEETRLEKHDRRIRAYLLHAGHAREDETIDHVIRDQSGQLAFDYRTNPSLVVDAVLDRCAFRSLACYLQ